MPLELVSPWALLLALPVLLLPLQPWFTGRNRLAVAAPLVPGLSPRRWFAWLPGALQGLGVLGMVVALARPERVDWLDEPTVPGTDIVLVVDTSLSMGTRHAPGFSRLDVTQRALHALLDARPHDRVALVAFGDTAHVITPLTTDHTLLRQALDALEPGMMGTHTALGDAVALGAKVLRRVQAPDRLVVAITDGADNASVLPPIQVGQALGALDIELHVVGVGRPISAEVVEPEGRIDLDAMRRMAEPSGGRAWHASHGGLEGLLARIDELVPTTWSTERIEVRRPLYRWVLAPALGLLASGLVLGQTVLRRGP